MIVRHSGECRKRHPKYDQCRRKCYCRKALYIYEDGKKTIVSAKTRSCEETEKFKQAEDDRRDPAIKRLREIDEQEAHKLTLQQPKDITVLDATKRWVASQKAKTDLTVGIYERAARRIQEWGAERKIERMSGMTPDELDLWRGTWSPTAEKEYSRMGQTTQSHFQGRLRNFCRWCLNTEKLAKHPTVLWNHIPSSDKETQPLDPAQFQELLDFIPAFIAVAIGQFREFGKELKAPFLLQRYTGLRITDALMLPRNGVCGNLMTPIAERPLPPCVVEALQDLSPDRHPFHPDHFFWDKKIAPGSLTTKWGRVINALNQCLSFRDEEGDPMRFHSHIWRDTFAVELLSAGYSIEDVSFLLTHADIKVTRKHYAPWVKRRRDQVNDRLAATPAPSASQGTGWGSRRRGAFRRQSCHVKLHSVLNAAAQIHRRGTLRRLLPPGGSAALQAPFLTPERGAVSFPARRSRCPD